MYARYSETHAGYCVLERGFVETVSFFRNNFFMLQGLFLTISTHLTYQILELEITAVLHAVTAGGYIHQSRNRFKRVTVGGFVET